ncbi:hypothetical protein [Frateuria sp.]|uniref:hypothetical protein n=1 Tax=Frateuria sp. TaxID=2211372 RepID=UPI003F801A44
MEVGRSAFNEMNSNLCSFAMRWELDGDYMRCRKCNRPQITDYANVDFIHASGCKAAGNVESRPWETFLLLLAPLIHANSKATATPAKGESKNG